jgi:hypothetical protein
MFPLILSTTQQQQQQLTASFSKQPTNQNSASSFSRSFLSSGKQGGGETVLREGHDIVTRETWDPTSLNLNLGKAAELHPASLSSVVGAMPNSVCH